MASCVVGWSHRHRMVFRAVACMRFQTVDMRPHSARRSTFGMRQEYDRAAAGGMSLWLHVMLGIVLLGRMDGAGRFPQHVDTGLFVEYIAVPDEVPVAAVESRSTPGDSSVAAMRTEASDIAVPDAEPWAPSRDEFGQPESIGTPEAAPESREPALVHQGTVASEEAAQAASQVAQVLPKAATVDPVASGNSGENDLAARYRAAVRARIEAVWLQLAGTAIPRACSLAIRQQAGGTVLSAQVVDCDLDGPTRDRLEAVVLMAQPLPYAGFERVFVGELQVDMRPAAGR